MPIKIPSEIINIRPDNDKYVIHDNLIKAVEVAMKFDQPLLLTGEPGTGKTLLAYYLAEIFHEKTKDAQNGSPRFAPKPLRFNTKTTSSARDLFYTYDAIGHFQEANIKREKTDDKKNVKDFLELQALGRAILLAGSEKDNLEEAKAENPESVFTLKESDQFGRSHVVLIDEIDKAPRDFTNDILNEIENSEFFVKELKNKPFRKDPANPQRIVIIMTSNSEKNLPEAFLRRCVFYHIEFPKGPLMLKILKSQLKADLPKGEELPQHKIDHLNKIESFFQELRAEAIRKKPATAELVAFVKMLEADKLLDKENLEEKDYKQWFQNNLVLLAKTREDLEAFENFLKKVKSNNP